MTPSERFLKDNIDMWVQAENKDWNKMLSSVNAKTYAIMFAIEQIADIGNKSGDNPTWANLLDKISELKAKIP